MATVNEILEFVESLAPQYMKEDWDNVGLLCGRREREVSKILVALDPFYHVCREAVETGADLLLTHHPLIFAPMKAITGDTEPGECAMLLIENGISAINAHTNLDLAPEGVNQVLAQTLGLSDIEVLNPEGENGDGQPYGLLHAGNVEQMPLEDFLARVKEALGTPALRYTDGGRPVSRVAVGGGACGGGLYEAVEAGCDTFVTSDVKYNQFWDAQYRGLNLIDAGHFYTENPVCFALAEKLRAAFPDIAVEISRKHEDCMKFC